MSAAPSTVQKGRSATLGVSCSPAAASYIWTGGTCVGSTSSSCIVAPTVSTDYSVTGSNSYGASTAHAQVTVKPVDLTPILMLLLD